MSLIINCHKCGKRLVFRFLKKGERYKCYSCYHYDIIPETAEETAENPPPHRTRQYQTQSEVVVPVAKWKDINQVDNFAEHTFSFILNNQHGTFQSVIPIKIINFTRAFWLIAISILVMQILSVVLFFKYFSFTEGFQFSNQYYLVNEIGSSIWFIVFVIAALIDIYESDYSPSKLFSLDFSILKKYLPDVLKYFAICFACVLFFAAFFKSPEIMLAEKSTLVRILAFVNVVIMAPVCEEMIFRGYFYTAMTHRFKRKKDRLIINAMLFASAHVFLFAFFIGAEVPYYIFIIGYFLAKLYEESRSILPSILLHALNNFFVILLEILNLNGFALSAF